ncbi:T9SS type A sorting domain-containing protein [bacterium]|nr:T9SS type A sorting domain-containing protein [bacterium]
MQKAKDLRFGIALAGVLGMLLAGPAGKAQSVTTPIQIGTSAAARNVTLGIPRWKAYMRETNPNQFWACYINGNRALSNISYTSDGGETWSTNAIQIDPAGYLDMHLSVFGRNGNLYATWPGRLGITFRKFSAPVHSNTDGGPLVPMAGTTGRNRSNIMVQNTGRIWVFTRLSYDSPSENVLYNYSDNEGASWTQGTAYATNSTSVRIGSMPYVGGNPALIVLHLADSRGLEYYLWDGTSFVAKPDHSIFPVNMKQTRAFTHNVVNDTTFHLVFGLDSSLHHVWKNFNNGTGTWNHEIIESYGTTLDNEWLPTSTVRGNDLYIFYARKLTSDIASSMIYYRKWNLNTQTWTDPVRVSNLAANTYNLDPNTSFHVPTSSPYIPVIWSSGNGPYSIYFAKVIADDEPTATIDCPTDTLAVRVCGPTEVCIPLEILNATDITVSGAAWQNDTLCVNVDTAGLYIPVVTAVGTGDTVICSVPVVVSVDPAVTISCPPDTIDLTICHSGLLSISLPIVNQTQVDVTGATWSNNRLSFSADTSGVYSYLVTASTTCTSTACTVVVKILISPSVDLYLANVDVLVSNPLVLPGETVTLSAIAHSYVWSLPVSNIVVRFFDGDPNAGGEQIGADQIIPELTGGHSDTVQVQYVMADPIPRHIWVLLDPDGLIPECVEDNNSGMLTIEGVATAGSVYGTVIVSADAAPLSGVIVNLLDTDGYPHRTSTTDASGSYMIDAIPPDDYILELVMPLGFGPVSPSIVLVTIAGVGVQVDYGLRDLAIGSTIDFWWWKRQLQAIRDGNILSAGITRDSVNSYCIAIFDHFYDRVDGHQVAIEGVTYTGTPARALTFDDVATLWFDVADASNAAKTRKYFLTCLFNIVTARLSQRAVVSVDGATASQAITYFADKYLNSDPDDVMLAINLSRIFSGDMVAAGVIPLSTPNIMYKSQDDDSNSPLPSALTLSQNYPNPFNPTTTIAYSLPKHSRVLIQVFNVMGQSVRTLVDEEKAPGAYQVTWDGLNDNGHAVGSGVYLYRITSDDFAKGKKMLLLK